MSELNSDKCNILIACGGTGGHLFPGIAVAQEITKRGGKAILLISEKAIDKTASDDYPDLTFVPLPAVAMPKLLSPRFPIFLWRFFRSFLECKEMLRRFDITAVLGMGGFTSLPPIIAGHRTQLPTFVHESNAFPGKANRIAARFCDQVFIGMAGAAEHFSGYETLLVGTPVREAILSRREASGEDKATARESLGLDGEQMTVVVTGGSQGARAVNAAMIAALEKLPADALQVFWITGPNEYQRVKDEVGRLKQTVNVVDFCNRMEDALCAADLAVARAGASTLTEFSAVGLPAVLIPYPFAADDHQTHNARNYAESGAALLFQENEIGKEVLADTLSELAKDRERLAEMSSAMAKLFQDSPAATIANRVLNAEK